MLVDLDNAAVRIPSALDPTYASTDPMSRGPAKDARLVGLEARAT